MPVYKCTSCQSTITCNGVEYAKCPVCNDGELIPVMQALDNLIAKIDQRNKALFEFKRTVNVAPVAKMFTLPRFDVATTQWYTMGKDNLN